MQVGAQRIFNVAGVGNVGEHEIKLPNPEGSMVVYPLSYYVWPLFDDGAKSDVAVWEGLAAVDRHRGGDGGKEQGRTHPNVHSPAVIAVTLCFHCSLLVIC